jgi:hypothetical protein
MNNKVLIEVEGDVALEAATKIVELTQDIDELKINISELTYLLREAIKQNAKV